MWFLPLNIENIIDRAYEKLGSFKETRNYKNIVAKIKGKKQFKFFGYIIKKGGLENLILSGLIKIKQIKEKQ